MLTIEAHCKLVDIRRNLSKELFDSLADWETFLKRENLDIDALLSDLAKGVVREYVPSYYREVRLKRCQASVE